MDRLQPYLENMETKSESVTMSAAEPDPARPYNDLPPLPPSAELETRAVLKKCVAARTALGRNALSRKIW